VAAESRYLRLIRECLVCCSMRLEVPFIASRQLGAVGDPIGRQLLPFVGWCTGQSSAPPDMNSSCPVLDLLPFLVKPTVAYSTPLAHRTVRCNHPTVGSATCPVVIEEVTNEGSQADVLSSLAPQDEHVELCSRWRSFRWRHDKFLPGFS
jgi:hypothetical protein